MKTTVYMVRHAESPFIFGEERSRELSEQGKLDAIQVAERMEGERVDVIVSSPYVRAVQTVEVLARRMALPIVEYEELRERPIKGLDYQTTEDELLDAIRRSFEDIEYCLVGGESTEQAQKRAIPVVQMLLDKYEGKRVVIETHGNIMTIIMNFYDRRYGYQFWASTSKPDIYELEFADGRMTAVTRRWK